MTADFDDDKSDYSDASSASQVDPAISLSQIQSSVRQMPDQLLLLYRAVESTRNGIVITDPKKADNPIIYCNPAFAQMTGFRTSQIIGRNCRFLQRDDRDQMAIKEIREALADKRPVTTVLRNYKKNGQIFWNELTVSPVFDQSGSLINYIGVQNDVSARMEAERRVSEFYSVISHELRTPLTSINGALRTIEDGSAGRTNAGVLKMVRIALGNSNRLMRLIGDILDLKKIESGKFKLVLQKVQPSSMIDSVIDNIAPVATESGVKLKREINAQTSVLVDPDRVVQILNNLASNAIKFSPPNGEVILRVENPAPDTTRFSVIDHGSGIPADQMEKLFGRFQQLDSSDKRKKEGTGLGLFISRSLVELHGGHIGVESAPGKGSTFWFDIF